MSYSDAEKLVMAKESFAVAYITSALLFSISDFRPYLHFSLDS